MNNLSQRDIILYGAGNFGVKVYNYLKSKRKRIKCFVDETPEKIGSKILDTQVLSLNEAVIKYADAVWIICIFQPNVKLVNKYQKFENLGIKDIMLSTEFISMHNDFSDRMYFPNRKISKNNELIFSDEASNTIYDNFIKLCNTGRSNEELVTSPFDEILLTTVSYSIIYDLGAYDGDSHCNLSKLNHLSYTAYEPDFINFRKLQEYQNEKNDPRLIIINKAVGPYEGTVAFSQDGTMGSKVIEYTSPKVGYSTECISLNSILEMDASENAIVKMDIEGFELETILSAIKKIKQKAPVLIISVYHSSDDLEQIYRVLCNLQMYNFYLRQHGFNGMDLMLYCLPKKF